MEFILNRNYSLRSTSGHILDFKKGEPLYVPPAVRSEVVALGGEPVEGEFDPLGPVVTIPEAPSGEDRKEQITTAMQMLVERNGRNDFTAQGQPNVKAIEKIVGFDIEQRERDELWTKLKTGE